MRTTNSYLLLRSKGVSTIEDSRVGSLFGGSLGLGLLSGAHDHGLASLGDGGHRWAGKSGPGEGKRLSGGNHCGKWKVRNGK